MKKVCVKLHYNWRQCGQANGDWGEDYDVREVGKNGVTGIRFEINTKSWIVDYEDGKQEWIYNPNQAFFENA